MIGAIVGDIAGSEFEFNNIRTKDFRLFENSFFTDDTIMTIAVYKALKKCKGNYSKLSKYVVREMQRYGRKYPYGGYGRMFRYWLKSNDPQPYNSFGNGAGMRISPVAYFASSLDEVKNLSKIVTEVTHNHPEGIKGGEAIAVAVYLAREGKSKEEIKTYIEENYYQLNLDYENLKANYIFNETCQNSVPQALYCFLISKDFEDCIRTTISIGGDSDTLCAMSCAIAEAYYGEIPSYIETKALSFLDKALLKDVNDFKKEMSE